MTAYGEQYVQEYKKLTKKHIISRLEGASIEVNDYIMELYDDLLISPVADRNSRANPLYYRDEFVERLNNFERIEVFGDAVNFIVPSMDNFDFSGRLKMTENIMDGTAGVYIEVDGKQYESLFPNKKPPVVEALDRSVPKSRMIYLVKHSYGLEKRWKSIFPKTRMVMFPFSNVPPIRLFEYTNDFVDERLDKWIDEAVDNTADEFKMTLE